MNCFDYRILQPIFQVIKKGFGQIVFVIALIYFIKIFFLNKEINPHIVIRHMSCPNLDQNEELNTLNVSIWTFLTEYEGYLDSAIKLIKSIKNNTCYKLENFFILEIRERPLPAKIRYKLENVGWKIKTVNRILPRDEDGTYPKFRDQFTKLELWNIDEYEANIYFDADTLVIRNIDEFLNFYKNFKDNRHKIGVTRDIRRGKWQRTFNMGVFIIKPNKTEYRYLLDLKNNDSFKFETTMSEQGFLNEVYKNQWYEIGFENNANIAFLSEKPDYWWARSYEINIIHFTMQKPWDCSGVYKKVCSIWEKYY